MKKAKSALKIMAILMVSSFFFSCNPIEDESTSASLLVVENVTGLDQGANVANFLDSDVVWVDPETGQSIVRADVAQATLKASLLDPNSILGPSQYNDILVNRYVVTYSRSDGKNTPGVDVPYSFDRSLSTVVRIDTTETISIVVVREVAKLEAPLINLVQGRGEGVLEVTAKIDFYGQDLASRKVKAIGYLTIRFANFADQ